MKLFYRIPEGGKLKTGINICHTFTRWDYYDEMFIAAEHFNLPKFFVLYFVSEKFGFFAICLSRLHPNPWSISFEFIKWGSRKEPEICCGWRPRFNKFYFNRKFEICY